MEVPDNLEKTDHTFDGKPVYQKTYYEGKSQGKSFLHVRKKCENCGRNHYTGITRIVQGKKKGCSEQCGLAIQDGHDDAEIPYKGVNLSHTRADGTKMYEAKIMKDGEQHYLGSFTSVKEAAKAYDKKALELYENPYLNFPDISRNPDKVDTQ